MSTAVRSDHEPRTYRGASVDELLPKIRAELGPDAIVVRQREGLSGGVAGFFQRRCVEVVARRAAAGVDAYDGAAPAAAEPRPPAIEEIMRVASPFVDRLRAAEAADETAVAYVPADAAPFGVAAYAGGRRPPAAAPRADETAPAARAEPTDFDASPGDRSRAAANHERTLAGAGIAPALAAEIVDGAVSHAAPFAPRRALKHLVRDALARRIPVAAPPAPGGRAIAFVGAGGAGKTLCAARLAAAYAQRSDLAVRVLDLVAPERGGRLAALLEPAGVAVEDGRVRGTKIAAGRVVTVIDTPAVSPSADAVLIEALAVKLGRLGEPEVHLAVPATLSAAAVRALLDAFAPLAPAAIALTHLDEVGHAGAVVDEAIARDIPISYTSAGGADDGFAPADGGGLAARILS